MAYPSNDFTENYQAYGDFTDLEAMYGFNDNGVGNSNYDFFTPKKKEGYVFDPKNPPIYGCTTYHPPLKLNVNSKDVEVFGSSCINPIVKDADIYVSLDSMADAYAWETPWDKSGRVHIRYFIRDGGVPPDIGHFKKCIDYLINALDEGKKVHIGCIAGHGRTGIMLSALAQKTIGDQLKEQNISAIDYVRDTYCANAVENMKQILFLHTVCGVDIPSLERKRVNDFKELFLKEIGMDVNTVVEKVGFDKASSIISDIDRQLSAIYNPPKPFVAPKYPAVKPQSTTTLRVVNPKEPTSYLNPQGLPMEPNGTIAMGNPPANEKQANVANEATNKTFRDRLDPAKLEKLKAFKLKRMK